MRSTPAVTSPAKKAKTATLAPAEMAGAAVHTMIRLRDAEQAETGVRFLNARQTVDVPRAVEGHDKSDVTA